MSVYSAFARSAFHSQLAYRNEVWANIFGKLVQVIARVAIWQAAYAGVGATVVGGVSLQQMVTYALLGGAVMGATRPERIINEIGRSLKTGDVAVWLLKPIFYPLYIFANECGSFGYRLMTQVIPTVAVTAMFYGMLPPASLFDGAMFIVFWMLSVILLSLMSMFCGLIAFWLMTSFSLDWVLGALLQLFSGLLVPFWFFPEPLATIARHLPFAWVVYYPNAVYLGRLSAADTWFHLGLGLGWAGLFLLGVLWLWRSASTRITVQGG
ncbi:MULTISPECIES: ABC transporter permease [unclassified Rhizobium]|uniref:ABC transporter permease n=1 Tax=unclassified Rhizobium TaxID=2613769 RepID=UPI0007EA839A|nr:MULTISPECIES: ABC-2 family transporter protein [unclassified Rhizobium]ANM11073.1 ABC-2 type transporter permease protein [Rhizobium sp. N324]OYD04674.1 ABC-2 type transporter permease protein [Rhizobium sp. N4311]